ncbi:MAG TPA: glycosyltransferase family 4 protein [Vicinamibacterales bacterium]|nr:glycosyltransferase family 4 protein [Vicinamibacterales bacterium]
MRILWLNAGLLLPLDKGGKLRTWHLMRHLARRHDITYLSFQDPSTTAAERDGMREVCSSLHVVTRHDPAKGSPGFYADAATRVFDRLPYAAGKYRSREYRQTLERLLRTERFDLLVCDFLVPAVNMPRTLPCPSVVFTHNVEAEIWRRHYERQRDPIRRWLFKRQWQRMLRFEADTLSRFDLALAVSDTDRTTLQGRYPTALPQPPFVVATGVDTTFFAPRTTGEVMPKHLVFTGSMDWIPNEDAMTHFCHDILPLIRRDEPDVTIAIVGRTPTPAVQRLADIAGVEVTGRVDDVRDYIGRAAVYVVPIRIGGGTRLKIFEAMSMGRAVVSTTVGAEGLPVTDGRDVVIADTPSGFAHSVVALLRDTARRVQLEQAARDLVVTHYDWSAVAGQLEHALALAADGKRTAEAA